MMKRFFILSLWVSFGFSIIPTLAQDNSNAQGIRSLMLEDWTRAKAYTLLYLDAMPEDGTNYKPAPDVRSFAEQWLHTAQGNIGLSANGTGAERIFAGENLEKSEQYKNKESLRKVVAESYDYVIRSIEAMDISTLQDSVRRGRFGTTRLGWINKAFEHQGHHRGQTVLYLRLKGVEPPGGKLFIETLE